MLRPVSKENIDGSATRPWLIGLCRPLASGGGGPLWLVREWCWPISFKLSFQSSSLNFFSARIQFGQWPLTNRSQMFIAFATYSGPYFWWFHSEFSPIMIPWNLQGVDHIMLSYISGMAGLCLEFVQISVFYGKWYNDIQDRSERY